MRKSLLGLAAAGALALSAGTTWNEAAAAGASGALATAKPADQTAGTVHDVRWRGGRGIGVGLALGLGLGLAFAPRYSYAYDGPYYRSYSYYDAPPRRRCWYSHRYDGVVCRRYY